MFLFGLFCIVFVIKIFCCYCYFWKYNILYVMFLIEIGIELLEVVMSFFIFEGVIEKVYVLVLFFYDKVWEVEIVWCFFDDVINVVCDSGFYLMMVFCLFGGYEFDFDMFFEVIFIFLKVDVLMGWLMVFYIEYNFWFFKFFWEVIDWLFDLVIYVFVFVLFNVGVGKVVWEVDGFCLSGWW